MASLVQNRYGKGRVRVMRVHKDDARYEVREASIHAMVEGDFARAYTEADNSTSLCTDTVKNVVNIVAREEPTAELEVFALAIARRLLDHYGPVSKAAVTAHETRWTRLTVDGAPHPHTFTLDANGKPFASVTLDADGPKIVSGVSGFTFLKATQSGWAGYIKEPYTTLQETDDRIAATAMESSWTWRAEPSDYAAANRTILDTMLTVFATTYSHSVQDSLFRMGSAALEAVPEIADISLACPNKHYIPVNLSPFGMTNPNAVFVATDEPHGQIECTIAR
ncbi:factor-independent urate hydroxylase [Acuticoccus kandeliae]|uniref:factor-independent urate hydroxylase n=1 Tax=Acuticoccus kandeliae TaxID=2073160 RepID=UPI000D3EC550|nr:urate oxidase [Acuticoccus kandeliae]